MINTLLIGMQFYDYENAIIHHLKNKGHDVKYIIDKESFLANHIPFLPSSIGKQEINHYQKGLLDDLKTSSFDYVLVLVGRNLEPFFLERLRETNPKAKFILYLWDDVKRVQNFDRVKQYYDNIFTFDPQDAQHCKFGFLPLFYRDRYDHENNYNEKDYVYDIFSAMNCHSDREKIARDIQQKYREYRIKVILTDNGKSMIKRRIKGIFHGQIDKSIEFRFRKNTVSQKDLYELMIKSKAILDVQFPSQRGLTMRTFDTMCVGRKLITTNNTIQYYNFYNPNNVCIIDREDPLVSEGFMTTQYEPISNEIVDSYSIDSWISVLFENNKIEYLTQGNPYQ